jgi:hypothetical protein
VKLPVGLRLLKERYFGEAARNPWVARNRLAELSERLPAPAIPIVSAAVDLLMDYQDPDYALLYLDRIERYVGAGCPPASMLVEMARLMSERMVYDDPIRCAQLTLQGTPTNANSPTADLVRAFTLPQIVAMLPPNTARLGLNVVDRLGWRYRTLTLRFSRRSRLLLMRTRLLAAMRPIRPYSYRFIKERAWVERWLHMIDRSEVRQHAAAEEVVETARLVTGSGPAYQHGLENWDAVIDGLVKPVCDGRLTVPDFAATVRTACQEVAGQSDVGRVKQMIAALAERSSPEVLSASH